MENLINRPFVITASHYDETVSVQIGRSDLTYTEVFDLMIRLSKAIGFHESTINDTIIDKSNEIEKSYDTHAETF